MIDKDIYWKIYTKEEIKKKIPKLLNDIKRLEEIGIELRKSETALNEYKNKSKFSSIRGNYMSLRFYLEGLANIYEILEDIKKAKECYMRMIEINKANPDDDIIGSSTSGAYAFIGEYEKSIELISKIDIEHSLLPLYYERMGKMEEAKEIYIDRAKEYENKARNGKWQLRPHYLQDASDLYEKAGVLDKARELNKKAMEAWNSMESELIKGRVQIELAWLHEEIGYIYYRAKDFDNAMIYYDKAEENFKIAYNEKNKWDTEDYFKGDFPSVFVISEHLFIQIPEAYKWLLGVSRGYEEPDFKRIKYRKLLLEKEMKEKIK